MTGMCNTNERGTDRNRIVINSLACSFCGVAKGRLCITRSQRRAERIHKQRERAWIKGEYPGSYRETGQDT